MSTVTAHLNGGPQDDVVICLPHAGPFMVGKAPSMNVEEIMATTGVITLRHGRYTMRRDFLGEPVPHDLSGAVEYDWRGWTP